MSEREQPEPLLYPDDPQWDCTDAAHPAWWRGSFYGSDAMALQWQRALEGPLEMPGTMGSPIGQQCRERTLELRREIERLSGEVRRLEGNNAQLHVSLREAWDTAHRSGKGEWGEFVDGDGSKWVVRYWADHLGWVVTCFRQDEDGPRRQCFWFDLPEEVRALAVERLGITIPECRTREIPTGGEADLERARELAQKQ